MQQSTIEDGFCGVENVTVLLVGLEMGVAEVDDLTTRETAESCRDGPIKDIDQLGCMAACGALCQRTEPEEISKIDRAVALKWVGSRIRLHPFETCYAGHDCCVDLEVSAHFGLQ